MNRRVKRKAGMKAVGHFPGRQPYSKKLSEGGWSSLEGVCFNLAPLFLHLLACSACLLAGFRLTRECLLVLDSHYATPTDVSREDARGLVLSTVDHEQSALRLVPLLDEGNSPGEILKGGERLWLGSGLPEPPCNTTTPGVLDSTNSVKGAKSGAHLKRHSILIRKNPHPNFQEVAKGYELLRILGQHQQRLQGMYPRRRILAVTPTYSRTFQALHLTGLVSSLRLAGGPLLWIVVEAGGRTNETRSILLDSGLQAVHLELQQGMSNQWHERVALEERMREHALLYIRKERLEGMVVFADDSNGYSPDFFEEVQNVQVFGAASVSVLVQSGFNDVFNSDVAAVDGGRAVSVSAIPGSQSRGRTTPVQGPSCNASGTLAGWHIFTLVPPGLAGGRAGVAEGISETGSTLQRDPLEWAGFVFDAKLLWLPSRVQLSAASAKSSTHNEKDTLPPWVRPWEEWAITGESGPGRGDLLSRMIKDERHIEPMGDCGQRILIWWLRVEARHDSRFYSRWIIDPPLSIVVPAKRTPWPDPRSPPPPRPSSAPRGKVRGKKSQSHRGGGGGRESRGTGVARKGRQAAVRAVSAGKNEDKAQVNEATRQVALARRAVEGGGSVKAAALVVARAAGVLGRRGQSAKQEKKSRRLKQRGQDRDVELDDEPPARHTARLADRHSRFVDLRSRRKVVRGVDITRRVRDRASTLADREETTLHRRLVAGKQRGKLKGNSLGHDVELRLTGDSPKETFEDSEEEAVDAYDEKESKEIEDDG